MEHIFKEQEKLEDKRNLKKGIEDVQAIIDQLKAARGKIESDPQSASVTLAKLQGPVKKGFDKVKDDLVDIRNGLRDFGKALDKKFREQTVPYGDMDAVSAQPGMINRAIAMHLLREGQFEVASTFINDVNTRPFSHPAMFSNGNGVSDNPKGHSAHTGNTALDVQERRDRELRKSQKAWDADFSPYGRRSENLQEKFAEMYHIVEELRNQRNLQPAIVWARQHSRELEDRGSTLEYDLCRLQYVSLFTSSRLGEGPLAAVAYARQTFPRFPPRHAKQTYALLGALAFTPNIKTSPYAMLFANYTDENALSTAANAFTAEFCALLRLSSASPLLTAVTAGCIALPTLLKLNQIQALHRTSWTTASELPAEIPLPPGYQFHSVFVCPVSKEQATDSNPPMMMPCQHVIAKESLDKIGKGGRFKCPYCPAESHVKDAIKVYL